MLRRPPSSTRTDTLFPATARVRSGGGRSGASRWMSTSSIRCSGGTLNRGRKILRGRLSRAAKVMPTVEKQLFRQFLAEIDPDGPRRSKKHSWSKAPAKRSEEHTSELQSLMRISYAVFCLKKKKQL